MINKPVDVAVFQKEKNGQTECGDSFFYMEQESHFVCALADGLGSGKLAKESSKAVIDLIQRNIDAEEVEIISKCNEILKDKRGVVLGILKINYSTRIYTFSSIGNIGLIRIMSDNKRIRNIPKRGYLANYYRDFKVIEGKIEENTNFILYTDGVAEAELTHCCFLNEDVHEIVDHFQRMSNEARDDDTTLIAIRYNG